MTTEREELIQKLRALTPTFLSKREMALIIGALQFADFAHRRLEETEQKQDEINKPT